MYWRLSFYEMTARMRLKLGEQTAIQLCHYMSFAEVVSAALGGKKEEPTDITAGAASAEQAVAMINAALSG